jgi:hypothetical protein
MMNPEELESMATDSAVKIELLEELVSYLIDDMTFMVPNEVLKTRWSNYLLEKEREGL